MLILILTFGAIVTKRFLLAPFEKLLSLPSLKGLRILKPAAFLLTVYLIIDLVYCFSGTAILSFIAEKGQIRDYIMSSMFVGIAVASITRILASSGLCSIILVIYYQAIFTGSVLLLFWAGPSELTPTRKIFDPVARTFLEMIMEGQMAVLIFLLFLVFVFTELIIYGLSERLKW